MKKSVKKHRILPFWLLLIMALSILNPTGAMAGSALEIRMETSQAQDKILLSDLRITDLAAPQPGLPFPAEATVTSAEGMCWQVAVLWTDLNGSPVSGIAGTGQYRPVIVFFVPSGYTVRGTGGSPDSFRLAFDDSVLALFGTDNPVSVLDADRNLIYILNGQISTSAVQQEERVIPSRPVSGMPEKYQAPKDNYRNPNYVERTDGGNRQETAELPAPAENKAADSGKTGETLPAEDNADPGRTGEISAAEDKTADPGRTGEISAAEDKTADAGKAGEAAPAEDLLPSAKDSVQEKAKARDESLSEAGLSGKRTGAAEQAIPEIVSIHCSKTALKAMNTEDLASLVELVKHRLQPQAVELLKERFPAYQEAAKKRLLGEQLGLYVYFEEGDKDDVMGHSVASPDAMAFISAGNLPNKSSETEFKYILGVNASFFVEMDEDEEPVLGADGKARFANSEKNLTTLENTIVHEMMHLFMFDYNRVGMTGVADPKLISSLLTPDGKMKEGPDVQDAVNAFNAHRAAASFPGWFIEGLATSVENNYQFRYETFNLLSYADGQICEGYSPEILRNAYSTSVFRVDPDKPAHETYFDLESISRKDLDSGKTVDAVYSSGYLACLYLGELAANRAGETSRNLAEDGDCTYDSRAIREGINLVLRQLHDGKTLDDVIRDLSDGRFADTKAFEQKFIKGDADSAEFCAGYLNYMRTLAHDEDRKYLPNGSVLYPFDCDFVTPLDRTTTGDSALFRIVDSTDFVKSTVNLPDIADGGRSIAYREYMARLKLVEEERTQLAAQKAMVDEIAAAVSDGGEPDPNIYDFIMNAVIDAQIVDPETKGSIILAARTVSEKAADNVPDIPDKTPDPAELWSSELPEEDSADPSDSGDPDTSLTDEDLNDSSEDGDLSDFFGNEDPNETNDDSELDASLEDENPDASFEENSQENPYGDDDLNAFFDNGSPDDLFGDGDPGTSSDGEESDTSYDSENPDASYDDGDPEDSLDDGSPDAADSAEDPEDSSDDGSPDAADNDEDPDDSSDGGAPDDSADQEG